MTTIPYFTWFKQQTPTRNFLVMSNCQYECDDIYVKFRVMVVDIEDMWLNPIAKKIAKYKMWDGQTYYTPPHSYIISCWSCNIWMLRWNGTTTSNFAWTFSAYEVVDLALLGMLTTSKELVSGTPLIFMLTSK